MEILLAEQTGGKMSKVQIIVPSKGRPENAYRLLNQVKATIPADADLSLVFAVDGTDESLEFYPEGHTILVEGGTMVKALNELAIQTASHYDYLGFLGDDTLPKGNWYNEIVQALESQKNSIVYANDGIYGEQLPTGAFLDANIVRTLGFMAPPTLKHLFVDNYWKALGEALGTLVYLENTVIEHIHPFTGTVPTDAVYDAAYTQERWDADQQAFITHMQTNFVEDVLRFKE
jgi:hypothetical protein